MESKIIKNTTKEDHFVKAVAAFKIIYNQNQYLAYTEMPKKKKDFPMEIYVGRLSNVRGQYLLFKCETDTEKTKVFALFQQLFSGEPTNEIELIDFQSIERMSIVSSNEFDEKMDQYPNFFPLPKKEEEVSTNLTLPSFLMKKKKTDIPENQEEIQFDVNQGNDVLEPVTPVASELKTNISSEMKEGTQNSVAQSIGVEPTSNVITSGETQTSTVAVQPAQPENSEQQTKKPKKKKNHKFIFILLIFVLLVAAGIALAYIFLLKPESSKEEGKKPEETVPATQNLVCTFDETDSETGIHESSTVTIVYYVESKKVITEEINSSVQMKNQEEYDQMKAMIQALGSTIENTDGLKLTHTFDDKNMIYNLLEQRNYEKATVEEKDEEWNDTYDAINNYYLNLGYTCNGVKKPTSEEETPNENETLNETTLNLSSTTGNREVDYDNWNVKFESAILSADNNTLTINLTVQNKSTDTRNLNGNLKLYDQNQQNLRNYVLKDAVEAGQTITIKAVVLSSNDSKDETVGSLETVDLSKISSYLIELYR